MKAPNSIHKSLIARGFGYGEGHYMAFMKDTKLSMEVRFDKCKAPKNGVLVELMIFYPSSDSAFGIVPLLTTCLRTDGKLWQRPLESETDLHFDSVDVSALEQVVGCALGSWFNHLTNAELMIQFSDHLMGKASAPEVFRYAESTPYLERKETVHLLHSKAAYLIVAGRFQEAVDVLNQRKLQPWQQDPITAKLMKDAQSARIEVSPKYIDWMKQLGAQIPDSLASM